MAHIPDHLSIRFASIFDEADAAISIYQETKKKACADLREDLKELGFDGASASMEISALKVEVSARQKRRANPEKVVEKEESRDYYRFVLDDGLTQAHVRRAEATGEVYEHNPPETATRRVDDLGSVQDARKMSTDGQPTDGLGTSGGERSPDNSVTLAVSEQTVANPQSPSNRDLSAGDEASSEAGPQAQASLAGTGSEMLADREGHPEVIRGDTGAAVGTGGLSTSGGRSGCINGSSVDCTEPTHDDDGILYCDTCGIFEGCRRPGLTPSMQVITVPVWIDGTERHIPKAEFNALALAGRLKVEGIGKVVVLPEKIEEAA